MKSFSETIRQKIIERANNRCEYCLSSQQYVMGHLQIDHIMPIIKGGMTIEDNLCLACELCNQYKWTKTDGKDPKTGKLVRLFNPRKERWIVPV